jgi:hypothetical protein
MNYDSGTALLRHFLILIARAHLFLAEVAGLEFHLLADGREVLGEEDAFCVQTLVVYVVAEEETALLVGVAVEVEKGEELLTGILD